MADVVFTSIVDPNTALAHQRIDELQKGKYADKWRDTKVFKDYRDLLNSPVNADSSCILEFRRLHLGPGLPSKNRFHLQERPDALFIGLPPSYHGSIDNPKADIELQLAKVLICRPSSDQRQDHKHATLQISRSKAGCLQAGMNIFVEKPLSVRPVEEVDRLAAELKKVQEQNGVTIAVGYMLRYSPAVEVS